MKKSLLFIICSFAFVLLFTGCGKDNVKPQTTELEITVVNINYVVQSNAKVILYKNYSDWLHSSNSVSTKYTTSSGRVNFTDLETIQYYFDCISSGGTMNNFHTTYNVSSSLTKNQKTSITAVIK